MALETSKSGPRTSAGPVVGPRRWVAPRANGLVSESRQARQVHHDTASSRLWSWTLTDSWQPTTRANPRRTRRKRRRTDRYETRRRQDDARGADGVVRAAALLCTPPLRRPQSPARTSGLWMRRDMLTRVALPRPLPEPRTPTHNHPDGDRPRRESSTPSLCLLSPIPSLPRQPFPKQEANPPPAPPLGPRHLRRIPPLLPRLGRPHLQRRAPRPRRAHGRDRPREEGPAAAGRRRRLGLVDVYGRMGNAVVGEFGLYDNFLL